MSLYLWLSPEDGELAEGSSLDNSLADGVTHQFCAGMQVQLTHDILAVPGHCFRAEHQRGGNLFIARALRKKRQHFLFPFREVRGLFTWGAPTVQEITHDMGTGGLAEQQLYCG